MTLTKFYKGLLGATALTALSAGTAFAGGTAPGVSVSNTFTLDYTVGTTPQTQITNSGDPTTFTVDRLVDLTVANEGAAINTVSPGEQDAELVFSLTNEGNDTHGYALSTSFGTEDMTTDPNLTIHYYIDDGDGMFQTGGADGALINYDPANPPQLGPDEILWVVVRGDIDLGNGDGETAEVNLIADTLDAGTTNETLNDDAGVGDAGDGINQMDAIDTVLLDAAGTDDLAASGDHSAQGTYVIGAADLTATKEVSVFRSVPAAAECASIPGTPPATEQYPVPMACMEYVIEVQNLGSQAATAITLNDDLSGKPLTFVTATATGFTGGAFDPLIATFEDTDCDGGTCNVNFTGASLPATSTGQVIIRALVN